MMRQENMEKEKNFIILVITSVIIAVANVAFVNNRILSSAIILTEIVVLLYFVVRGDFVKYLSFYMIFICNCMEMPTFVGNDTFYNLKNARIFSVNLGIWTLLPALFLILSISIDKTYLRIAESSYYKYSTGMLFINIVALVVGGILIALNDNEIQRIGNYTRAYINTAYTMIFLPASMIIIFNYIYTNAKDNIGYISLALEATLWGTAFQIIYSSIFEIYGSYGALRTLLCSNISFILPFLVLLSLDEEHIVYRKCCVVLGLIGTVITLSNNASGKLILLSGAVVIVLVVRSMKERSIGLKIFVAFLLVALINWLPVFIENLKTSNILFNNKLNQSIGLLEFWKPEWFQNMPNSPKIRIGEILNILYEYWQKPWLAITGKGFLGSIKDNLGLFQDMPAVAGSFSSAEWKYGIFYNLHEIAAQLLMYGLIGSIYTISLLATTLKRYADNIWILLGGFWFFILYGYSFTITTFCVIALFYGLKNNTYTKNTNFM